jgi:hypothetical protein
MNLVIHEAENENARLGKNTVLMLRRGFADGKQ